MYSSAALRAASNLFIVKRIGVMMLIIIVVIIIISIIITS